MGLQLARTTDCSQCLWS